MHRRPRDPTGCYFLYEFLYSETKFNDYPKFGVWPDACYMSVNQFEFPNFNLVGPGAAAYERDAMLVGDPLAQQVIFDLSEIRSVPPRGPPHPSMLTRSLTEGGERPAPRASPGRSAPSSRERRAQGAELHRLPCRP
jgi:hypothetical protein